MILVDGCRHRPYQTELIHWRAKLDAHYVIGLEVDRLKKEMDRTMGAKEINIAAAVIVNPQGQTLLVRKSGTQFFMQAGGKLDDGELAEAALARELEEELNLSINVSELKPLGTFSAKAANEADHEVVADLFLLSRVFEPKPAREIAEAIWVTPSDAQQLSLAPLTRNHVLPILDDISTGV